MRPATGQGKPSWMPRIMPARQADDIHLVTARAQYQAGNTGPKIVETQRRGAAPSGTRQMYRNRPFFLSQDQRGQPVVQFVVGGTLHELSFSAGSDARPLPTSPRSMNTLLELGHRLAVTSDLRRLR